MTAQTFLVLLTIFPTVTGLFTEALKKVFDSFNITYAANLVALVASFLVGGGGTIVFYIFANIEWTAINICCVVLMAFANWLGATVGYDKVTQLISQLKK